MIFGLRNTPASFQEHYDIAVQNRLEALEEMEMNGANAYALSSYVKHNALVQIYESILTTWNRIGDEYNFESVVRMLTKPTMIDPLSRSTSVSSNLLEDAFEHAKASIRDALNNL